MISKRSSLPFLIVCALSFFFFAPAESLAFHFPWDQGHDTFQPDQDEDDPPTCDKCNSNPSPYNAATGAFTINRQDLSIPGRISLEISRTYHSRDRVSGPFGEGWTYNYGLRLIEVTDGEEDAVIVLQPDGHRDRFVRDDNGNYISPADVFDLLTKQGDGNSATWEMKSERRGMTYDFNGAGALTGIRDRNGNTIELNYDSAGALNTVIDMHGRKFHFVKGVNGKIHKVIDPLDRTVEYGYDSEGRLISVSDPEGATIQYRYSASGKLNEVIDPEGRTVRTASFDDSGRLVAYMEDGESYTLTHTPSANRVVETDSRGNQRTILYNDNGNITSKSDHFGNIESFAFDDDFNPSVVTDKRGNATTYVYNDDGSLRSMTDARGNVTTYEYDPRFQEVIRISEPGRVMDYVRDSNGNITQERVTSGGETRTTDYTLDAFGQVLVVDGPRPGDDDTTRYTYDQYGNVASITTPSGDVASMTYDLIGRMIRMVEPNGLVVDYRYDGNGNEIFQDAGGEVTTTKYTPAGLVSTQTLPTGQKLTYKYDQFARVLQATDGSGDKVVYTRDYRGNVTREEYFDSSGAVVQTRSFQYDRLDRLTKEIGTRGQETEYFYDPNGNVTRVEDPLNHATLKTYDELNRLKTVTFPDLGEAEHSYDPLSFLTTTENPLGLETVFTVNGFGEVTQELSPERGTITRGYDEAGNLTRETDARGETTTYQYNELSLLEKTTYGDGSEENRTYGAGAHFEQQLRSIVGPNVSLRWTYDLHNRPRSVTQTSEGISLVLGYQYQPDGLLLHHTYPSGKRVTYTYDGAGKLSGVQYDGEVVVKEVEYFPYGAVQGWKWKDDTAVLRSYDTDGRLSQYDLEGERVTNVYDLASRIQSQSSSRDTRTYRYDSVGRLTDHTGSALSVNGSYQYDLNGNRLLESGTSGSRNFQYDPATSRLSQLVEAGSTTDYTYDEAGNLISDGTNSYQYDTRGRLTRFTSPSSDYRYEYNGLGQRVSKTQAGAAVPEELYMYNEFGQLLGVYDQTGSVVMEIVYVHGMPVSVVLGNGELFRIHVDHLSTPRTISDEGGTVVWRWDSTPFGIGAPDEDPDGDLVEFVFPLRFPGQYFDPESHLHYNYFRDYDPQIGRYIEADPIGLGGGLNLYSYAEGNPITKFDLTGEAVPAAAIAIRAAIAAAWRALQQAIKKCAGNPVCRCRAFYAAYKSVCSIPCKGCTTPGYLCCGVTSAQAAAAGACVTLRGAYIASKCDIHIPTTKNHPAALAQAQKALANCSARAAKMCKCLM
ncbi:DUF6531 domain-containing protein [bacterium]|nr:DUF6531 domain-containing protein [bacterium]